MRGSASVMLSVVYTCLLLCTVLAGDVRCLADAQALMDATGADGVMSAEPLLMNPMLFDQQNQPQDVSY